MLDMGVVLLKTCKDWHALCRKWLKFVLRSEAAAERDAALAAASSALMGEAEPGASPAVEGACKRTFTLFRHLDPSERWQLLGRFIVKSS